MSTLGSGPNLDALLSSNPIYIQMMMRVGACVTFFPYRFITRIFYESNNVLILPVYNWIITAGHISLHN